METFVNFMVILASYFVKMIGASFNMENCIFCLENGISQGTILAENKYCYIVESVDPGLLQACLVIPRRHVASPFEFTSEEWQATHDLIKRAKGILDKEQPSGYNLGWNVGEDAGQHIFHAHLHVIARFKDEPLRGKGIRHAFKHHTNTRRSVTLKNIWKIAEELNAENKDLYQLLLAIRKHIYEHSGGIESTKARTILESRFTPPEEAYAKKMRSCGSTAGIAALMLRHLGYQVKLIDGRIPQTRDHAWISIFNPKSRDWEQYDLTEKDVMVTPEHVVELECESWEDIREHIEAAHETYSR